MFRSYALLLLLTSFFAPASAMHPGHHDHHKKHSFLKDAGALASAGAIFYALYKLSQTDAGRRITGTTKDFFNQTLDTLFPAQHPDPTDPRARRVPRHVTHIDQIAHLYDPVRHNLELSNTNIQEIDGLVFKQIADQAKPGQRFEGINTIFFANTPIRELPAEIGLIQSLTQIAGQNSELRALPANIDSLQNLTGINISGTAVTELPAGIYLLPHLVELHVMETPLIRQPTWHVTTGGLFHALPHLRIIQEPGVLPLVAPPDGAV